MSVQRGGRLHKRPAAPEVTAVDRDAILSAARQLFRQKGYHATTMQDIADSFGLQRGSLYHHISSKEELLIEICEASVDDILLSAEVIAASASPPAEKLKMYILVALQTVARRQDEMIIWLNEWRRMPSLLAKIIVKARKADRILSQIIEDGYRDNSWPCKEPQLAYQAIRSMIAWFPHWFKPDGNQSVTMIANVFVGFALSVLREGDRYLATNDSSGKKS